MTAEHAQSAAVFLSALYACLLRLLQLLVLAIRSERDKDLEIVVLRQ